MLKEALDTPGQQKKKRRGIFYKRRRRGRHGKEKVVPCITAFITIPTTIHFSQFNREAGRKKDSTVHGKKGNNQRIESKRPMGNVLP